jgi:hypothetical protein
LQGLALFAYLVVEDPDNLLMHKMKQKMGKQKEPRDHGLTALF